MSTHSNGLPKGMVGGMDQAIWNHMSRDERKDYSALVARMRKTEGTTDQDKADRAKINSIIGHEKAEMNADGTTERIRGPEYG